MQLGTLLNLLSVRNRLLRRGVRARPWLAGSCLLPVLVAAGCSGPTTPGGQGGGGQIDYRSALFVSGSITDAGGDPVFGSVVRITVYTYQGACTDEVVDQPFEGTANEVGRFAVNLTFKRDEFDACLTIEAIPPADSGLSTGVDFRVDVEINELTSGVGSIELDFVLPRQPS